MRALFGSLLYNSMSTYTRLITKSQLRHPAGRSASHQRDKLEGDLRREKEWVAIPAVPTFGPHRNFGSLVSHEFTYEGGEWKRCEDPEAFADYLELEAARRNWFYDQTQRKGRSITMRRPAATALENLTINVRCDLADWIAARCAVNEDPRPQLRAIRNAWLEYVQEYFEGRRYILGYAFHADTNNPHFDLIVSRQDGLGGRIGRSGLNRVGEWMVSTFRHKQVGAVPTGEKHDRWSKSIANFQRRYGDTIPTDIALAKKLDAIAEHIVGQDLQPYREQFAARIAIEEYKRIEARAALLEAEAQKERQRLAQLHLQGIIPFPRQVSDSPSPSFPI